MTLQTSVLDQVYIAPYFVVLVHSRTEVFDAWLTLVQLAYVLWQRHHMCVLQSRSCCQSCVWTDHATDIKGRGKPWRSEPSASAKQLTRWCMRRANSDMYVRPHQRLVSIRCLMVTAREVIVFRWFKFHDVTESWARGHDYQNSKQAIHKSHGLRRESTCFRKIVLQTWRTSWTEAVSAGRRRVIAKAPVSGDFSLEGTMGWPHLLKPDFSNSSMKVSRNLLVTQERIVRFFEMTNGVLMTQCSRFESQSPRRRETGIFRGWRSSLAMASVAMKVVQLTGLGTGSNRTWNRVLRPFWVCIRDIWWRSERKGHTIRRGQTMRVKEEDDD